MEKHGSHRIYALDALRGLTIAAMMVVNNAGGKQSFACLQHSEWNGMTFCDLVFPSFLFIMGISTYISLRKTDFQWSNALGLKIARRTIIILLIGWAIHWFELALHGAGLNFAGLRLTGVLPRIAVCYCIVSMLALVCRRRTMLVIAVVLLTAYSFILFFGNGFDNSASNIISRIDNWVLGAGHIYTKRPIDPEGLVSNLGALAHTLIGFGFGAVLLDHHRSMERRLLRLMVFGSLMLFAGMALALGMPLNKRVWSPTFVLASCGIIALALAVICYYTDLKDKKAVFRPFDIIGLNPLFLYALSEVCAIVFSVFGIKARVYGFIAGMIPEPCIASLIYSLLFLGLMWVVGYALYLKRIFIKI